MKSVIFSKNAMQVIKKENGNLYAVYDSNGSSSFLIEVEITENEAKEIMRSECDAQKARVIFENAGREYRQHDGVRLARVPSVAIENSETIEECPSDDPLWPANDGWMKRMTKITLQDKLIEYHSLRNKKTGEIAKFESVIKSRSVILNKQTMQGESDSSQ